MRKPVLILSGAAIPSILLASGAASEGSPELSREDKKAVCDAVLAREVIPLSDELRAGKSDYDRLVRQFRNEGKSGSALATQYKQARTDGKMEVARALAGQRDAHWNTMRAISDEIGALGNRMSPVVDRYCTKASAARSTLAAMGCTWNDSCSMHRSNWEQVAQGHQKAASNYAGTWRKAEDHNFDDPNVLAACAEGPAVVPFPARIVSVKGRAFVVRGMKTFPASEGMKLAAKDIVASEDGSIVTIYIMGSGELKITEKSKFEIPERFAEQSPSEPGLADQAGQEFKKILQGESFEIKTPTATCGVRG